jgi:hypothetical protein
MSKSSDVWGEPVSKPPPNGPRLLGLVSGLAPRSPRWDCPAVTFSRASVFSAPGPGVLAARRCRAGAENEVEMCRSSCGCGSGLLDLRALCPACREKVPALAHCFASVQSSGSEPTGRSSKRGGRKKKGTASMAPKPATPRGRRGAANPLPNAVVRQLVEALFREGFLVELKLRRPASRRSKGGG